MTKVNFLITSKAAFFTSIGEIKINSGFSVLGLVRLDPAVTLSKLDMKLRTLTPWVSLISAAGLWTSQTPHNPMEAIL